MANKLPKIKLPDSEPLQGRFHDGDGNFWSIARLIDDTKGLEPFDCPLSALDLSYEIWKGADIVDLAFHCKKVNEADLSEPIILSWNGAIADGRHRIIKAIIQGKTTIKAVRMHWRPTPCETKEN
jgi:hypothetical protein